MITNSVETPYIPGKDVAPEKAVDVWESIIEEGRNILDDTHLVQQGELNSKDLEATEKFFNKVAEINPEIFNPGLRTHIGLTARTLRVIGEILNEQGEDHNLYELETLANLHDLGRTFTHRKGRNEVIADTLFRKLNIRNDLVKLLPPDEIFNPTDANKKTPSEIDSEIADLQRVIGPNEIRGLVLVADLLGKYDKNSGKLRRWNTVTTVAHASNNPNYDLESRWPSEQNRMTETLREGHSGAVNELYNKLGNWAEERLGVDLDSLVERVESSTS
mgnify:CR=1 FL=1